MGAAGLIYVTTLKPLPKMQPPRKCGDLQYCISIKGKQAAAAAAEASSTSTDSLRIFTDGTKSLTYSGCAAVATDSYNNLICPPIVPRLSNRMSV